MERWCTEANEATQTHCYNPVAPAYLVWAYYEHGRQRRCQEDPVSLPSGRLEKTTRSSRHHMAQHRPTGSETTPSYAPEPADFALCGGWRRHMALRNLRVACQKRRQRLQPFPAPLAVDCFSSCEPVGLEIIYNCLRPCTATSTRWSFPLIPWGKNAVKILASTLSFICTTPKQTKMPCGWRVTTYVGKPSAVGQPTWPTQPFILSG